MKNELLRYLQEYPSDPFQVDRLIVSAFLYPFNLKKIKDTFIQNYLITQDDDDYSSFVEFLSISRFSEIEELIEVFEFVISPEEKIITGAVYTPKDIREYIVEQCFRNLDDLSKIKICDPSCGCGGFLFTAAKTIHNTTGKSYKTIFADIIYGLDIQKYAIDRSRLLLTLLAITEGENTNFEFNLMQGNALEHSWSEHIKGFKGFNVVVGNPPYVCSRNIEDESKKLIIKWKVSNAGHPDLYIPFFQIGIESLIPGGVLGFITMNTFFKSVNGRALRQYFEDEAIALQILDFGGNQVFQSKSTYTCICIIQKRESQIVQYAKGNIESLTGNIPFQHINYSKLNHRNGWNLQHNELLSQIERAGPAFGDIYRTRNGIATLKNHIYIFKEDREDEEYYYIKNGAEYPIEKGICKDIINPNKLTKAKSINDLKEKVIFPYEFDELGNANLIAKNEFKAQYPKAFGYFQAKKKLLATRDKGEGNYEEWYAYGRNQSLEKYRLKLFFPHISSNIPNYIISEDEDLLFYNGIAVVSDDKRELRFLQKLMSSDLFWFYVINSSKPYGSGYFSLSRNYIKNFGVVEFSEIEKSEFIKAKQDTANRILEDKYKIILPESNDSGK